MTIIFVPVAVQAEQPQTSTATTASTPQQVFHDAVVQLAAIDPIAALAALSPVAALAALSPVLKLFNPAVNVRAALLAFNPAAAHALAVAGGKYSSPCPWRL